MQEKWSRSLALLAVVALPFVSPAAVQANQPPHAVASAGVDINTGQVLNQVTLYIGPADTGIAFTVNGAGSSDPDGDPLTYSWECREANGNKCLFGFGVANNQVNYRPTFPAGTWDITLTVNDGNFHTATDTVRIKVLVDTTPPTVIPPQDTTVSSTEAGGARGGASSDLHNFLSSATAMDNSTAIFTHLPPQVNGVDVDDNTLFPQGPTVVTFRIADNFGNVGMATAEVYVTDIQTNDVFVGAGRVIGPFGETAGQVMLIRGGNASLFCKGPDNQGDPQFFYQNVEVLVDSLGRAVFLAAMPSTNSNLPHYGLFRCDFPGDTPRMLGVYEGFGSRPAGDPVQFPGDKFGQVGGLHLVRTRAIVIQNQTAQIVNEDSYVFAAKRSNGTFPFAHISLKSVRYRSLGGFSEDGPEPEQSHNSGSGFVPDMTNYKGDTYSGGRSNKVRRQSDPLVIQASGSAFNTQFNASLHLFGGIREIDGTQSPTTWDPLNIPNVPTACGSPPPPGVSPATPASAGSYYSFSSGEEIIKSQDFGLLTTYNGLGLCGTSMTATCPWSPYLANVDEYLIDDDPNNDTNNRFLHDNCTVVRSVPVRPVMPLINSTNNLGNGASKLVVGPQGLLGTQFNTGRVFRVPDSPTGVQDIVSTVIPAAWGIAAFPPQNVSPSGLVIVIQINSPVDVLVTDPSGRRLGVEAGGTAVNDFAEKGHDTGAASHPRFFAIRDAQPGSFSVSSVGTGAGPFEIHIFGVNLDRTFGQHLLSSGMASLGVAGKHDFTLDSAGGIVFSNTPPIADAGVDQTATADAAGNATVSLDGSASFDPDGDALSFNWGTPAGAIPGVSPSVTLQVGLHVLTLTVDDGKGATAEDTVQITVNALADTTPPVVTPPADITVTATEAGGARGNASAALAAFLAGGSATDNADPNPAPLLPQVNGADADNNTLFPLGSTAVTFRFADASGNIGTASSTVTVFSTTPQGAPMIAVRVVGQGVYNSRVRFYDLEFANTGTVQARSLRLDRLTFTTLTGSGTVGYVDDLTGPLPLAVGDILVGTSQTVRVYFYLPATVTEFRATIAGPVGTDSGQTFEFEGSLVLVP
jgi:hypothetical protein